MWVFIIFNVFAALGLYWLARMPKPKKEKMDKAALSKTRSNVSRKSGVAAPLERKVTSQGTSSGAEPLTEKMATGPNPHPNTAV